jgi:hypothetical protein
MLASPLRKQWLWDWQGKRFQGSEWRGVRGSQCSEENSHRVGCLRGINQAIAGPVTVTLYSNGNLMLAAACQSHLQAEDFGQIWLAMNPVSSQRGSEQEQLALTKSLSSHNDLIFLSFISRSQFPRVAQYP